MCYTVAELRLNQTSFRVPEGNLTENMIDRMFSNRTVCVVVMDEEGGLLRDVVINVTTTSEDATSK